MKKILALVLCAAVAVALVGCTETVEQEMVGHGVVETPAGMPNPVHEVSAGELLNETGISFTVPQDVVNATYSYIDTGTGSNPIAQMVFSLNGVEYTARVQGTGIPEDELPDISGLFYQWSETAEGEMGNNTAYYYFNPDAEGYVTWYDYAPGLLYSVSMSTGASVEALGEVAAITCPAIQDEVSGVVGDGSAMDHMTPNFEPASFFPEAVLPANLDLNVDGITESIAVVIDDGEQDYGTHSLIITDGYGVEHRAETFIQYNATACVADIDLDGRFEIFLSGDCGSDDYITYAWRWDGELCPIRFSGELRRGGSGESTDYVDGALEEITYDSDDRPTKAYLGIGSFTYMLGTYGSVCTYELNADDTISPVAPARWTFIGNETFLETAMALTASVDGEGTVSLPAGTKLRLTSTNGVDELCFATQDGRDGRLSVEYSQQSWGWLVDGIDENEAFVSLPYAG